MRFVVLLSEEDPDAWSSASEEETARVYAAHRAFDEAVAARGRLETGAALASGSRTLHGTGPERRVTERTEGPYAESVEQLTGLYVIDVASFDDAVELVGLLPESYTVEVREVAALEDY